MATELLEDAIVFPPGFDARAVDELPLKGYIENVIVRLGDGRRYCLSFIDPVRLNQDLEVDLTEGRGYVAEVGLVVLPTVTVETIRSAVEDLCKTRYFDAFGPLD